MSASQDFFAFLVKGGLVMVPLLASSILALAVVIERWWFWQRFRTQEDGERILDLVTSGLLTQAMQRARASRHPVAKVLLAGLEYRNSAPSMAMEAASQAELHRLKRYLPLLDTVITLAPLLGLLGTITGMISAFGIVSASGLGQPHAITSGVAEALIATATGLAIAILTLVPYNYFRAKVEAITQLMEETRDTSGTPLPRPPEVGELTMRIPRREPEKARIEVIPMIDIVFFLLVFFMISTLSMTVNRSLPVNLPKATSSQQELGETANLTVTKDGGLFLNKEPVTLQEIAPKLKAELAKAPELFVVISADDQTSHGAIVDVIDEMRLAGVSRLAIAVNPERRTQP